MESDKKKCREKDRCIGANIRQMRICAGLSQKDVAKHLRVTYQQVQKYEHGESRLSAEMLHDLTGLYHLPFERFYDELSGPGKEAVAAPAAATIYDDATSKIIASLSHISDPALKTKIGKIVVILAG